MCMTAVKANSGAPSNNSLSCFSYDWMTYEYSLSLGTNDWRSGGRFSQDYSCWLQGTSCCMHFIVGHFWLLLELTVKACDFGWSNCWAPWRFTEVFGLWDCFSCHFELLLKVTSWTRARCRGSCWALQWVAEVSALWDWFSCCFRLFLKVIVWG